MALAASKEAASFVGTADEIVSAGTLHLPERGIASNAAMARTNRIAMSLGTEVVVRSSWFAESGYQLVGTSARRTDGVRSVHPARERANELRCEYFPHVLAQWGRIDECHRADQLGC